MDINIDDQVQVNYLGEDVVGTVTHVRDIDDGPNKYRLLRTEDDWYLGWYTADKLSEVPESEESEESDESDESEEPEDVKQEGPDA